MEEVAVKQTFLHRCTTKNPPISKKGEEREKHEKSGNGSLKLGFASDDVTTCALNFST